MGGWVGWVGGLGYLTSEAEEEGITDAAEGGGAVALLRWVGGWVGGWMEEKEKIEENEAVGMSC